MRRVNARALIAPLRRIPAVARRHRAFSIVLALGVLVHALLYIAYFPGLFFPDSYTYLSLAWFPQADFVGLDFSRPSGYPIFLWAIEPLTGHHVARVALIQQVLSIGAGVLVYVVLDRLGARRWLAVTASALVLFDAYVLVLAQTMLSDTLAMLLVVSALALVALLPSHQRWGGAGAIAIAAGAGLLLGYGVTVRTVSLFVFPILFVYVLWSRKGWMVVAAVTLGFVAPVLSYLQWHKDRTGAFSFTQADGWFLYARIGEIGQCRDAKIPAGARKLCPHMEYPPRYVYQHLWGSGLSPAVRAFGKGPQDADPEVNGLLKDYAIAIIKNRPVRYTRMIGHDVLRYFQPGVHGESGSDTVLMGEIQPIKPESFRLSTINAWAPRYRDDGKPYLPDGAVDAYAQWVHTPRWLLGIGTLLAGIGIVASVALRRRFELEHRREAFLLLGAGLALVVGATATSEFVLRYLVPAIPLLWAGIALVLSDVLTLRRARRVDAVAG